jgi:hypothetical protein
MIAPPAIHGAVRSQLDNACGPGGKLQIRKMGFPHRFILGKNNSIVHVHVYIVHVHDAPTSGILSSVFSLAWDRPVEVDCEFRQIDSSPGSLSDSAIEELSHQAVNSHPGM